MTSRLPAQCMLCAHWVSPLDRSDPQASSDPPVQVCSAFPLPDGIPDDVWWNRADHRLPVMGDGGVRWEPAEPGTQFPE